MAADSAVARLIHGRRTGLRDVVGDVDDEDEDEDGDDRVESIEVNQPPNRDVMSPTADTEMLPQVTTRPSSSVSGRSDAKSLKLDKLKAKIRDKLLLAKTTKLTGSAMSRKVGFVHSSDSMDAEETTLKQRLEQNALRRTESGYNKVPPTSEEAYDFFTSTWNEDLLGAEPRSPLSSSSSAASGFASPSKSSVQQLGTSKGIAEVVPSRSVDLIEKASTDDIAGDATDKSRLLASEVLELEDRWQLFQYVPANYRPHGDRLRDEETRLFYPGTAHVPIAHKLPEQTVARHLAEEGLYVGRLPAVHPRNRNKMENRLLRNGELNWFGEDGSILTMADPTSGATQRPAFSGDDEGPKDLLTEYRKPLLDGRRDVFRGVFSETLQLDVDVAEVTFLHHHLFSKEHVLASRLTQYCRQFNERRQSSGIEIITKRLDMLRHTLANVRYALTAKAVNFDPAAAEGDVSTSDPSRQRQQEYVREVRLLRQRLDGEESSDRSILRVILGTWRLLRSLRDSQGYSNTAVQLQIIKKEVDKDKDLASWRRSIDAELEEEREDHAAKYAALVSEYDAKLNNWRKWKRRLKVKKKRKTAEVPEDGSPVGTANMPDEVVEEPQPPPPFDEHQVRKTIQEKALRIRRRPGEPILYPELMNSNTVTPLEQCPSREQRRRRDVARCKMFVRIMFNEKKVCQTATKNLGQDFTITFGEIFNLQLAQFSESLSLQIYEMSGLSSQPIAEIFLPVSMPGDVLVPTATRILDDREFSCDKVVAHDHDAVGSGSATTNIVDDSGVTADVKPPTVVLLTSGVLRCRAVWTSGVERDQLEVPDSDPPATVFGDMSKLKRWLENTTIDPNDPSNAHLVQFLEAGFLTSLGGDSFFLEDSQCDLDPDGSSLNDFFDGPRFRAIKLRDEEVPEFRNMRMIPMHDDDVPKEPFIAYEKRLEEEAEPTEADQQDGDSYRQKFSKYLHKMRGEVWKRYLYGKRPKELEDVVTEDQIPDIGTIGTTFLKWTNKTRPLRPVRGERRKVIGQSIGSGSGGTATSRVSILVNIANAFNVPVRKDTSRASKQFGFVRQPTTSTLLTISEPLVSPVIEVTFQHKTERTNASSGPNPCWNHDMQLEFRAPNENYLPASLQTVRDVIFFSLFDEVVVDILEDERDRDSHVHQRIDKRWLGTLQIPFSTLYLNTRIEGTFKMSCPPLLLGYNKDGSGGIGGHQQQQPQQQPNVFVNNQVPMKKDHTYLSIFLTLEPVLPLPEPLKENLESNESNELLVKAEQFRRWFAQSFPKRQLKTTVIYVNGKSVFVTRFIRELAPPHELLETAVASNANPSELVARFVSLIPVVSDVAVFPGICDIWTTNDQFLSVLAGDQEEHAVLLCNYFLYLKLKAFLLLGFAVPDGVSIYVLTRDDLSYTAWNASTGEWFDVQDSFCPIQRVGCLINHENIWVNIQPDCQPSRMNFDVNNAKNWKPFFDHKFPNPGLTSIQPETITYVRTESTFVDQLRDKIELTVRNQIMSWRKRFRTSWNRHCGQVLRKILVKMEQSKFGAFNEDEIQSELYPILSVYKMCGFPLSIAYAEMSTILEVVFATGVHLAEGETLEFALAVHVHPYPHNVVAVWIYVASLYKR